MSLPLGREWHGIIAAVDYLGLLGAQPTGGQTTGGAHATNSEHYEGRAVDFGVATQGGGETLIQDIYDALLPYAVGGGHVIDELFWQDNGWADGVNIGLVGGHYDHVHVGVKPTIDLLFEVSSGAGVTDPDAGDGLGGGGDPFDDSATGWAVHEGTTVGVTPTTEDGFAVYRRFVTVGVVPAGGVFIALQLTDGTYVEMDAYSCALGDIVIYGDDYEVGVVSEGEVNTEGWMHLGGPLSFVFTSYDEEVTFLWGWSSAILDTDDGHWVDTGPGDWVTLTETGGDNIAFALDSGGVGAQQISYPGDPLPIFVPPSYWTQGGPEEDLDYAAYLAARAGADDNSNTPPGVGQEGSWVSGGLAYGVTYTTGLSEQAGFIDLTGPLFDIPDGTLPGPDGAWGVVDENGSAIVFNDIRDIVLYVEAGAYENTTTGNSTFSVQARNLAFDYPRQGMVDDSGNLAVDRYMLSGGSVIAGWQTPGRGAVLGEITPSDGSQHAIEIPDPVPANLVQDQYNGHWVWPMYWVSTHTVDAEQPADAGYDDYDVLLGGQGNRAAWAVLGPYGDRISLQYRRPALRWFIGFPWFPSGEVFPRRWRQRDDGLGASGARWRGRTSMQESNRWKGYL